MKYSHYPQESTILVPLCAAFPFLVQHFAARITEKQGKNQEPLSPAWQEMVLILEKAKGYMALGQYEKAYESYKKLLNLLEAEKQHRSKLTESLLKGFYRIFLFLGERLLDEGMPTASLNCLSSIKDYFPSDAKLLKQIIKAQASLGPDYRETVEKQLKDLIDLNPAELKSYESLGRFYEANPLSLEKAVECYKTAINYCRDDLDKAWYYHRYLRLSPYDEKGWYRLGLLYLQQGMYLEAKDALENAYRLSPTLRVALKLAEAYLNLNQPDKAEKLLLENEEDFSLNAENNKHDNNRNNFYLLLARVNEIKEHFCAARVLYSFSLREAYPGSLEEELCLQGIIRSYLEQGSLDIAENLITRYKDRLWENDDFLELVFTLINSLEKEGQLIQARSWRSSLMQKDPGIFQKKYLLFSQGKSFWRKYEPLEIMGHGTFGKTILCQKRQGGERLVIKEFRGDLYSGLFLKRLHKHLETLEEINMEQLLSFKDGVVLKENYYAVWEYMQRGSLHQLLKEKAPLPLEYAVNICLQIARSLEGIYRKNQRAMHYNLKPENIFLSPGKVKLADYGLYDILGDAKILVSKKRMPLAIERTLCYSAPERLLKPHGFWQKLKTPFIPSHNPEEIEDGNGNADMYSIGVIFFEMLSGTPPFVGSSSLEVASAHQSKPLPQLSSFNPFVPEEIIAIISQLLSKDVAKRISSPEELIQKLLKARV